MALIFCESFDHYDNTTDWTLKWGRPGVDGSVAISGTGRFGTNCLGWGGNSDNDPYLRLAGKSTWIMGFAYRPNGPGPYAILNFTNVAGSVSHVILYSDSLGHFYFKNGNGTAIGGVGTWVQKANVWSYLEIKLTISDSAGVAALRVNGTLDLNNTSADTQNGATTTVDHFQWRSNGSGEWGMSMDDLYICDDSGSVNNDFLGDIRVQRLLPSGAGNSTQWTASAGSNYQCVDDATPNADTDYVSETTAGEKDTYAFGNLTPTSGTVKGVQTVIKARKDDAGTRSIAPVYRPVSTDYDGTTVAVSDSYSYLREITEVSPETSAAWTIAEINGAEFGVKLVS